MQDEVARLAHPVISYTLKIKDRIDRGEDVSRERSHAELERLLTPTAGSRTSFAKEEDVRYALTCWVDEIFILHSPWRQRWNETKLEFQLFRSNEHGSVLGESKPGVGGGGCRTRRGVPPMRRARLPWRHGRGPCTSDPMDRRGSATHRSRAGPCLDPSAQSRAPHPCAAVVGASGFR